MNPAPLYNCRPGHAMPDWSQFERLEIGGCCTEPDDSSTAGNQSASKAEFFTVYGRFPAPDGTCEAITDIHDAREALAVAGELSLISGLPCIVCPSLMEAQP